MYGDREREREGEGRRTSEIGYYDRVGGGRGGFGEDPDFRAVRDRLSSDTRDRGKEGQAPFSRGCHRAPRCPDIVESTSVSLRGR